MRRAVLLVVVSASILAAPRTPGAQQPVKTPRVGIVWINTPAYLATLGLHEAFRQGLRDLGYVDGKTLILEARFAEGKVDRLPGFMAELVKLKTDVIVAPSTPAVRAACSTGRSAGLAPFKILSTKTAARRKMAGVFVP